MRKPRTVTARTSDRQTSCTVLPSRVLAAGVGLLTGVAKAEE